MIAGHLRRNLVYAGERMESDMRRRSDLGLGVGLHSGLQLLARTRLAVVRSRGGPMTGPGPVVRVAWVRAYPWRPGRHVCADEGARRRQPDAEQHGSHGNPGYDVTGLFRRQGLHLVS